MSPTQGLNPGIQHCRQILYQLRYLQIISLIRDSSLEYIKTSHNSIIETALFSNCQRIWRDVCPRRCTNGQRACETMPSSTPGVSQILFQSKESHKSNLQVPRGTASSGRRQRGGCLPPSLRWGTRYKLRPRKHPLSKTQQARGSRCPCLSATRTGQLPVSEGPLRNDPKRG